jgi:hypothetical protein
MAESSTWLLDHRSNVYSQSGEDGVIQKILEILPAKNQWCVEFGAWDGVHLSNTCNLIRQSGFSAVLIEGSSERFRELKKNYAGNEHVTALNQFVGFSDEDCLDKILAPTAIPVDFDLLSIDIDGNDIHVWKAMKAYQPKIVCIEFNPTIPTEIEFIQPADFSINQGSSIRSINELARSKGYELICVLEHNAIFVKRELYPLFQIVDNRPEVLRVDRSLATYIFFGYDGTVFLRGYQKIPWNLVPLKESKFQVIPKIFRRYSDERGIHKVLYYLYLFFFHHTVFQEGWKRFSRKG